MIGRRRFIKRLAQAVAGAAMSVQITSFGRPEGPAGLLSFSNPGESQIVADMTATIANLMNAPVMVQPQLYVSASTAAALSLTLEQSHDGVTWQPFEGNPHTDRFFRGVTTHITEPIE